MNSYRPDPRLKLTHHHGLAIMEDLDSAASHYAELRSGRMYIPHLPTHQVSKPQKLLMCFREYSSLQSDIEERLKDIPHHVQRSDYEGHDLIVEGVYNISRTISALFNAQDGKKPLITKHLYESLNYEHITQHNAERHYCPIE